MVYLQEKTYDANESQEFLREDTVEKDTAEEKEHAENFSATANLLPESVSVIHHEPLDPDKILDANGSDIVLKREGAFEKRDKVENVKYTDAFPEAVAENLKSELSFECLIDWLICGFNWFFNHSVGSVWFINCICLMIGCSIDPSIDWLIKHWILFFFFLTDSPLIPELSVINTTVSESSKIATINTVQEKPVEKYVQPNVISRNPLARNRSPAEVVKSSAPLYPSLLEKQKVVVEQKPLSRGEMRMYFVNAEARALEATIDQFIEVGRPRLIDWSLEWSIDRLNDRSIDRLIDWLINSLSYLS